MECCQEEPTSFGLYEAISEEFSNCQDWATEVEKLGRKCITARHGAYTFTLSTFPDISSALEQELIHCVGVEMDGECVSFIANGKGEVWLEIDSNRLQLKPDRLADRQQIEQLIYALRTAMYDHPIRHD